MATENASTTKGIGSNTRVRCVAVAAALTALSIAGTPAWALGLGRLNVQSALGEPLRAEIDVTALSPQEAASLKARVASPETYRAAGIDYNQVLATAQISLQRRADGRPFLRLSSDRAVTEPFVDAILDLQWSAGRLVREYTLLFDPPSLVRNDAYDNAAPLPPITSVVMDPPPAPPTPVAVAPEPVQAAPAPAPVSEPPAKSLPDPLDEDAAQDDLADETPVAKPQPAPKPQPAVVAAPKPAPSRADTKPADAKPTDALQADGRMLPVRPGDTLSHLAEQALVPGATLEQMMVGLYRGNPQAFANNNMNRLKSGVVLKVPEAESVKLVSPEQARQTIVAQSHDFEGFKQRLGASVTTSVSPTQQRQAAGKVEAEVTDRKQVEAPKPDKLTLSKGGMSAGKTPGAEDRIAQKRAQQDTSTRVAELSRNLDDLSKLKDKVAKPAVVAKPTVVDVPASKAVPAPMTPPPAKMPPVTTSSKEADDLLADDDLDTDVANTPASAAATAVADVASQPVEEASASLPALPVEAAKPEVAAAPEEETQPGLLSRLNPAILAGVGALVALGGLGLFLRSRRKVDGAETSFLESRLQPDSFFGASGGQRVDTRDAGSQSSMSYSLSQLDAIGDVDPVAEADVYLAYGRDLQAEEILKEALRSNPERLPIRTKLMEVYAKRRDSKGVEFVARELFNLTQGTGPDWQRAQELGLSVDPGNPLYQGSAVPALQAPAEMDRTLPLSGVPERPVAEDLSAPQAGADLGADLDLDISLPPTPEMLGHADTDTQRFDPAPAVPAPAASQADLSIEFDLPQISGDETLPPKAKSPAPAIDLSTISLDLDDAPPSPIRPVTPAPAPLPEFVASTPVPMDVVNDPMMRKVELAHEFVQIGDVDGAKDLLKEVMSEGQEATRAKARELLDKLT